MSPEKAKILLAKRRALAFNPESMLTSDFTLQNEFIKDTSRLKALFCTRRSAKSYTTGMYMVYEALKNPGSNCLYLGLTRQTAKAIIWKDILKILNKKYNLKAQFNSTELTMTFPNGSVIYVTGVDAEEDEMNKLLGRKYRIACVDEASTYTIDLRRLVYGILGPAMTDGMGTICMTGTASDFAFGLFHDITIDLEPGWKLFKWSAHDNPYVAKQWQEELDTIDRDRPLFKLTNTYKQWYLNQWAVDEDKLVYKFNPQKNLYDTQPVLFPHDGWIYVLGVDLGWEDDNAFVLTGYHSKHKALHVIKTFNKAHLTFDQVADKINEFLRDTSYPISKVIVDGANKQGVESMRARSLIPFEYADKLDKVTFIEVMNGDWVQEKILIQKDLKVLIDQLKALVWKTSADKIVFPKKEHPALPNHLTDALLYAWRCGFHYSFRIPPAPIVPNTPEWYKQQEEEMIENTYLQAREEHTINQMDSDPFFSSSTPDLSKWKRG